MFRAGVTVLVCSVGVWLMATSELPVAAQAPPAADQAAVVLASARAAIGGDARLSDVKTFIENGRTRQVRGDHLVPIEFEIHVELPDKYSRRDEFPAQDAGPVTTGFNGERPIQIPAPPAALPDAVARARVTTAKQDFTRLMLGLFATSSSTYPLTFKSAGTAEAPQGKADVLDLAGLDGFAARFFVDSQTHLPLMVSWQARGTGPAATPAVETRLYFADYRDVDGLKLPFRVRRAVGAETTEETTFDRFRINARVDSRRFQAN